VPFTCTNSGQTWPGVAQHLSLSAPRMAPQNLVSLAHVRRIERSAGSRENVAQGLPWWRPARRGSPRPSSAHCVPATGRATQNGQRVEAERAAPPLPPTSGQPHGHDEPVLCHLKRRRRVPEGARYRE
jgi:hypothetical protein